MARILLIDDSAAQALCMARVLRSLGHEVRTASDVRQVLAQPVLQQPVLQQQGLQQQGLQQQGLQQRGLQKGSQPLPPCDAAAHTDIVLVELQLLTSIPAGDGIEPETVQRIENGFETGLALRAAGYRKVLLMTGVWRDTDEIWATALGLGGVLTRPLTSAQLGKRIDALMGL